MIIFFQVNIGGLALAANHNIRQIVDVCEEHEKEAKLSQLLKEICSDRNNKIIVFVETKKKVDDITKCIRREGYSAISIHGDKSQPERDYVLTEFRNGKSSILVATDVAARGLDVEDVKYVINFDYPNSSEDYVHRIGRTGRCQQVGTAYAFFTSGNQRQAKDLVAVLEEAGQVVNPKLQELAMNARSGQNGRNRWNNRNKDNASPNSNSSGNRGKTWNNRQNDRQMAPRMNNGNMRQNNGGDYQNRQKMYQNNGYAGNQYQGNAGYGQNPSYGQMNTYQHNGPPQRTYSKFTLYEEVYC